MGWYHQRIPIKTPAPMKHVMIAPFSTIVVAVVNNKNMPSPISIRIEITAIQNAIGSPFAFLIQSPLLLIASNRIKRGN